MMTRPRKSKPFWILRAIAHRLVVTVGAIGLTLLLFMVLPLMQHLSKPPATDLIVQTVDMAKLEAPPPPVQEEVKEEAKPEETPPELTENAQPLDLSQLELALNPGVNDGLLGGDFVVKLNTGVTSEAKEVDALFSIADLDQKPRIIYQPNPVMTKELRSKLPGTVYVIFVVDQQGKVENPVVQKSSDPIFEKSALAAIKQWKFEPGKRNGQSVRFRMRVPFTFPKG
jgi:protein TonB